jgi:glycosyltransferase involved in cell wall biosynthesis
MSRRAFDTKPCIFFGKEIGEISFPAERAALQPLLSIGIPTFNRASRLNSLLNSIVQQCARFAQEVEIIVSDNASTDETKEVVERYRGQFPIIYSRNRVNEGACRNVQILGSALSNGRFTWLIGDDDLVRQDAIQRVLAVIKQLPDVHFIFANTSPRSAEEYAARTINGLVNSGDFPVTGPVKARSTGDRLLNSFDELIDPDIDETFLGSLMCGIFRTDTWREYQVEIDSRESSFSSLATSYPHALVFAHTMVGRKAYFLNYPATIAFWGAQEWIGRVPRLLLLRLQDLLRLYEDHGVSPKRIWRCREALVRISRDSLRAMMLDSTMPGFDEFDLRKFISDNRVAAPAIFDYLDEITREARLKTVSNRLLQDAGELLRLYPSQKPQAAPPAAATAPGNLDAFQKSLAKVEALLRAGSLQEAVDELQRAKSTAPNAECVARADEVLRLVAAEQAAASTTFFSPEELQNILSIVEAYAADLSNADAQAQLRALRSGMGDFINGAELAQIQPLLRGNFGEVFYKIAELDLGDDPAAPPRDLRAVVEAALLAAPSSGFDPRPLLRHLLFHGHVSHT